MAKEVKNNQMQKSHIFLSWLLQIVRSTFDYSLMYTSDHSPLSIKSFGPLPWSITFGRCSIAAGRFVATNFARPIIHNSIPPAHMYSARGGWRESRFFVWADIKVSKCVEDFGFTGNQTEIIFSALIFNTLIRKRGSYIQVLRCSRPHNRIIGNMTWLSDICKFNCNKNDIF